MDSCSIMFVAMFFPSIGKFLLLDRFFLCLSLGALLDAVELMAPKLLECLYPVMHVFQPPAVQLVQTLPAFLGQGYDPDFVKHAQMFRHRRLRKAQRGDQRSDGHRSVACEQIDNLPSAWLGDG